MSRYPKTAHFNEIREYLDFCRNNEKPVHLDYLRYLETVSFKKFEHYERYMDYKVDADIEVQEFVNEMIVKVFKQKGTKITQEDLDEIRKEVADKYPYF